MKVLNIHKRLILTSKDAVSQVFATLATADDKVWPNEYWPRIKFRDGLKIGSNGKHGPIHYEIVNYDPSSIITFKFQKPIGFNGIHKFEITELSKSQTQIKHTIKMETVGLGTLKWLIAIRWLHDALIEDAFDKIENSINNTQMRTQWSAWVKFLRMVLK